MPKKNYFSLISTSAKDTQLLGKKTAEYLVKNKLSAILVISGDLGAGKTVFTKGLAKGLGINRPILSPSFVLLRSYRGKNNWLLNHIDAYRLSLPEAKIFNWQELSKPQNLTVVEWPEKISGALPKKCLKIKISHQDPETRLIELPIIFKDHAPRPTNRRQ